MPQVFNSTLEHGRIRVTLQAIRMGGDLLVAIHGGDRPHIGAVAVSHPRPGCTVDGLPGATTSVIALPCHREDQLARDAAQRITAGTGAVASVSCGIHLDDITPEEIEWVGLLVAALTDALLDWSA